MRFIADIHLHSHFSRATSSQLAPEFLDRWARLKGISVIGTGDFTHPGWVQELQNKLEPAEEGLFRLRPGFRQPAEVPEAPTLSREVRFILQSEISGIYKKDGRTRKVHNVILVPDFKTVDKIRQALLHLGANLTSDGRPILGLDSRDLLEIALNASDRIAFIPAHIWTPWFSILGSKSGFDSVSECFGDLTPHLTAMETGLSTDPPMHWTCTFLDPFTLVSNSDAHSPEKLGRNANIFDTELSFASMIKALKTGDPGNFQGTIDLFPQEGKYHYDGHRKCRVCWDPLETLRRNGICSACGKPVTVGVMHRVAQLADRDNLSERPNRLPFVSIIPLKELLSEILGVGPASKKLDAEYHTLLRRYGPELYILLDLPVTALAKGGDPLLAEAIHRMRNRRVLIQEGYDGEYGVIRVFQPGEARTVNLQQALFGAEAADSPIPQRRMISFDLEEYRRLHAETAVSQPTQLSLSTKEPPKQQASPSQSLNPDQQHAVGHSTGPALVIAGPGTGKTRVLTHRIAHLIREKLAAPEHILAITFTNKAADEIRQRMRRLLAGRRTEAKPLITTFHAFGHSILKEQAEHFGRSRNFNLLDDIEQRFILEKRLGCPRAQAERILESTIHAKQFLHPREQDLDEDTTAFSQAYEEYCRTHDLFDLADCIFRPVLLFADHPPLCAEYRRRYPWILIDEYQDINRAQYSLVRQLMPERRDNLFVVGDPDQAIYGFRGAEARYIQEFRQDYPDATVYQLKQSYRCSEIILRASGRVVAPAGAGDTFLYGLQEGVKIILSPQATDRSEAEFVARTIEDLMGGLRFFSLDSEISSGETHDTIRSLSDFAVLCRIKNQMRRLEKAFHDHGIPYQLIGDTPFFRQEPVRTLIQAFKLAVDPRNAFLRQRLLENRLLAASAVEKLPQLVAGKAVNQALAGLITSQFPALAEKESAIQRLLDLAEGFGTNVEAFLRCVALGSGADTYRRELESVTLMTLHAAKGLEFRCVFIVGCEDGLLPYSLFERRSDPGEERRLLYVGMTRAEKYLFLSHAHRRFLMGKELRLSRSPYLDRIEEELLQTTRSPTPSTKKETQMKLF
jgi:uncharacterized protein (TIGR00375 family)